jgi:hypothetical protein
MGECYTRLVPESMPRLLAKTLVPSYCCLYSLFNKIRDKGKIVSAGYLGGGGERRG